MDTTSKRNTTLQDRHPSLESILRLSPEVKTYRVLNEHGNISEYWERDDDGTWTDQTEREQLREQLEAAKEKLERIKRKEGN